MSSFFVAYDPDYILNNENDYVANCTIYFA